MVSIRKLEKMIEPYKTSDWGASDGFGNTYQCYKNGDKKSRLDEATWFLADNVREVYHKELIKIATELGLVS